VKKEFMFFPKNEYLQLKKRLDEGKDIYTTRINKEYGKYKDNQIVDSPFGELKVIEVTKINDLSDHPFLNELTSYDKKVLKGHRMELIRLIKVSNQKSLRTILSSIENLLDII
jgi:DNA polymerase III delta prime subunit